MKFFRKLKTKTENFLFDSSIYVKDRTFVLFSVSQLAALIAGMLIGMYLHEPPLSTLVSLSVIVICSALLAYTVKKNKITIAKIVVALLIVFVFLRVSKGCADLFVVDEFFRLQRSGIVTGHDRLPPW